MKSKIFQFAMATLILAGVVYSGSVFSQRKGEKMMIKKEIITSNEDERPGEAFDKLMLTKEQKKTMLELRTKMMKETLPIKNQIGEKEAHLKTISSGDNVDLNAVNSTIDEISALKAKLAKMHMSHRQEVRKILNEEQKVIFDTKGPKGMKGCCQMKEECGKMPGCGMKNKACKSKCKAMNMNNDDQMPEPPMMPEHPGDNE